MRTFVSPTETRRYATIVKATSHSRSQVIQHLLFQHLPSLRHLAEVVQDLVLDGLQLSHTALAVREDRLRKPPGLDSASDP